MAVRVMRLFSANVSKFGSPTFLTFTPGEIISDTSLAEGLVRLQCPVVDAEDTEAAICPKCRAVCSWKAHTKEITIVRANAGFSYNSQYFSFRAGDILAYPWLIDQAKRNHIPLEIATGIECPACHHVFY
jgi:hypothetical protein